MEEHVDPYRLYLNYPQPFAVSQSDRCADEERQLAREKSHRLTDYYGDEAGEVESELGRLFYAHRAKLYFGQRHYAPSPTWRDELTRKTITLPMPLRFVVRVHLFERLGEKPGRYLGFVSLRPPKSTGGSAVPPLASGQSFRYVIDAEIAVPSHMLRPRYHVLTTSASSARLGVLPFRSAVYSAPEPTRARGSTCVHLAVSQALHLIMGRFSCRPISQIEFDWHLWMTSGARMETSGGTGFKEHNFATMGERGANLDEALRVIKTSCNGGGFTMTVEPRENGFTLTDEEKELAVRFLTDALACGLPVIAMVRTENLLSQESRRHLTPEQLNAQHAVMILGMHLLHGDDDVVHRKPDGWNHREDRAELPGRLIIHDTLAKGPYFECPITDFLEAAEAAYSGNPEDRGVHLLAIGAKGLDLSLSSVLLNAKATLQMVLGILRDGGESNDPTARALQEYLTEFVRPSKLDPHAPDPSWDSVTDWRLVCRLLSAAELEARYTRDELLRSDGDTLPPSGFWVIEVRHPRAERHPVPGEVGSTEFPPPAVVLIWGTEVSNQDRSPSSQSNVKMPPRLVFRFIPLQVQNDAGNS